MEILGFCIMFFFFKLSLFGQLGIPKLTYRAVVVKRLVSLDQSSEPSCLGKFSPNTNWLQLSCIFVNGVSVLVSPTRK